MTAALAPLGAQFAPKQSGAAFGAKDSFVVGDQIQFAAPLFPAAAKQPGRFKSFLNGKELSSAAGFPLVPVGPFPPPGGWPTEPGYQYPFRHHFTNRYDLMAPVVADVLDTQRDYVVQRSRTLLYDRRYFESLIPSSTLANPRGVGVQLTPDGLDKLEQLHLATLPQPTLDAFNSAFQNEIASARNELTTDVRLFNGAQRNEDRICFSYGLARSAFPPARSEVASALADAVTQYGMWEALDTALSEETAGARATAVASLAPPLGALLLGAAEAAHQNACVKQLPNLDRDFEICFAKLEGRVTDADLFWVESVDLELSANSGQIDADPIELGLIEGTANIDLRDAFIRYHAGALGCGVPAIFHRPEAEFNDQTAFTSQEAANFARCPNVTFRAERALNRIRTGPVAYQQTPVELLMGVDGANAERVDFSQVSLGTKFDLIGLGGITANQGACALSPPLQDDAETVAEAFYPIVEAALGTTWDQLNPTRHARAMNLLFEAFEVGAYEAANHSVTWPVFETGTNADFAYPPGRNPDGDIDGFGLFALLDAQKAEPRSGALVTPPVNTYVQQHWGSFQGAFPSTALWHKPTDSLNQPYDVAMTMSVNALNQILGAQFSTDKLRFEGDGSGVNLPSLSQFAKATTRIQVRPNLTPFLYVSPEPHPLPVTGQLPFDGVPMALNLADLQVTLGISPGPGEPWIEAVRFAVDVYDLGVELRFSGAPGKRTLDFFGGEEPRVDIIPLYSKIPGCPIRVPIGHVGPASDCLASITADVKTAIEDELIDRLYSMLAEIPAPQFWYPPNPAGAFVQVEPLSNQTIPGGSLYVVFGELGDINEMAVP